MRLTALLSSKKGNAQYRVDLKDPTAKVDDEEVDLSEDPEELQEAELHDHAPRALPTDDEQDANRHNRQGERRRTVREDWLKDYTGCRPQTRQPRHHQVRTDTRTQDEIQDHHCGGWILPGRRSRQND